MNAKKEFMRSLLKSLVLLASAAGWTARADASVAVTFSGVLTSIVDDSGLFGQGAAGSAVSITYNIDPSVADSLVNYDGYGSGIGGQAATNPVKGGFLSLGGSSYDFTNALLSGSGGYLARTFSFDPNYMFRANYTLNGDDGTNVYYTESNTMFYPVPLIAGFDINELLKPVTISIPDTGPGNLDYSTFTSFRCRDPQCAAGRIDNVYLSYRVNGLTIAAQSAVPEPATWATMLIGLVAVAAALRLNRGTHRIYCKRLAE